jgi:starch phosphorylase
MDKRIDVSNVFFSFPFGEIEGFDSLVELALDMRWSWSHAEDELWRQLNPQLWDLTHNPWVVLQTASRDELKRLMGEPAFRRKAEKILSAKREAEESAAWFQRYHAGSRLDCVAYFSMEFMLSEALPIYSGGLGNVAGDQLKAASDLGVPVVGVGLLYQQGYFRQVVGPDGVQRALYPFNNPGQLPISPLRDPNGEWLRLEVQFPGFSLWLRAWQVQVGRVKLYLLDSNDPANFPAHRGITSELYGGDSELRFKQELVLGIGGWRLLRALGIRPQVCHLNEGHAAFAVLERAREFMEETGQPFDAALAATRSGNVFTTHTAVPAGFDRFSPDLIERFMVTFTQRLRIGIDELLALGRLNPHDRSEPFNMAYLAIRGSGAVNGVSRLHGEVSRRMFAPLFPRWPESEIPVGHVTNGVHVPSWDSEAADALWTEACGKDRWLGSKDTLEQDIRRVSDAKLWRMRCDSRKALVEFTRVRLARQLALVGESADAVERARSIFDPSALTLGFARRFATYKRPNLLLHDAERLVRLLNDPQRPVQLVIAGKAHPADGAGQAMIQQWTRFIARPEARGRVVFLSDYDMLLTEQLVQGVDVWLNTPRRPWEASGTSGMKVLANGGINLSELDGWWAEAYASDVGWAIGDGREHGDDPEWDAVEAERLYDILEREVVPEFYSRDEKRIPKAWVARMRESMASLTPRFSATRTVREYAEKYYLPALAAYEERAAEKGTLGAEIVGWRKTLDRQWPGLRFGMVKITTSGKKHHFEAQVFFDGLDPNTVRVELYADGDGAPLREEMTRVRQMAAKAYVYGASVPATRPAADFTPRVLPVSERAGVPLEAPHILWQK